MSYFKPVFKVFISAGILHLLLLFAHFVSLDREKYCTGKENFKEDDLEIEVQGGFVQKKTEHEVWIRAKDLELKIHFKSKKDLQLKVILSNIHPERTVVEGSDWKIDLSSFQKNRGFFSLSLQSNRVQNIDARFHYPEADSFKILVGGDAEEGYLSLLKLRHKLISENPLFLLIVGDMVDRGTKFRYKMHQDFFDTLPFPVFGVIGDGDLDKNKSSKKVPLKTLFSLYQQFYGPTRFVIHIKDQWAILGINDLSLGPQEIEELASFSNSVSAKKILAAHIPPLDPRENALKKKQLLYGSLFLDFLIEHHFMASFYGEIHSFFHIPIENHQMIITGGLGQKILGLLDYHYVKVSLDKEGLTVQPVFSHLNGIEEWLNKQGFWWWAWFYLCFWDPYWLQLQFLSVYFFFIFRPVLYVLNLTRFFKR